MRNLLKLALVGTSAAALTALSAPAEAKITTFANYSPTSANTNLTWLNPVVPKKTTVIPAVTQFIPAVTKIVKGKVVVVTPAHTIVITPAHTIVTPAHDGTTGTLYTTTKANSNVYGVASVQFDFLNKVLSKLGPLSANFSFQGTAPAIDPALSFGSFLAEPGLTGSFSFTYTGTKALHVYHTTYLTGANLLSGTFDGVDILGNKASSSGSVLGSTLGSTLVYTSDFLDFTKSVDRDLAIALTAIKPAMGAAPGDALHTFKASSTGAFSSDPAPTITAQLPEPATWTMMMLGFGMLGAAIRQRRGVLAAQPSQAS